MPSLVDRRLTEVAQLQRELAGSTYPAQMFALQARVEALLDGVKADMEALATKARPWTYVQPAY